MRQIATNFARLPELLRSATSLVLRRMRLAKLPDLLKARERDKEDENGTGLRSIIRQRGATYAFVHASAVRSCRGDRDSCVLCSVPSRSLR